MPDVSPRLREMIEAVATALGPDLRQGTNARASALVPWRIFAGWLPACERRQRGQKKTSAETELLGQVRDIPELVVLDFANTDQYSKLRGAT